MQEHGLSELDAALRVADEIADRRRHHRLEES